jgi:hypothetical protein
MSTALRSPIRWVAEPWLWILVGFSLTVAAAGIYLVGLSAAVGGVAVAGGLFCIGVGTAIRLQGADKQDFANMPALRDIARLPLTLFQIGVIAIFSWMLLAALLGIDPFGRNPPNPNVPLNIKVGPMLIAWLLVVPLMFASLRTIWRAPIPGSVETGLMLAIVCGTVVVVGRSLPIEADTLRFFFAVVALAIAFGISLVTASVGVRYAVLSILATLHFLAIITATLASPPAPWLAVQVWHRLAHPYLEFMYLNNAYHFYAPEPGATTHFWLCVYYDTGEKFEFRGSERPKLDGVWVKIPDVDAQGQSRYPIGLEYQRILSLNENIVPLDASPPLYELDGKGQILPGALLKSRLINSTTGSQWRVDDVFVGVDPSETTAEFEVPMVPGAAPETQYQKPAVSSIQLMQSYVRYAARLKHPQHPEWPVVAVRAYRALHAIPSWYHFVNGADPYDPITFRVTFNGSFDPETGAFTNASEPLRNWVLPTLRARPDHPDSPVFCWYLLQAGERRFIYLPQTKEYVRMTPELRAQFPPEWTANLHKYVPPDWVKDWTP